MDRDLAALETLLEGFLEQFVALKSGRIRVLEGMVALDSVVRHNDQGERMERLGDWMAENRTWLDSTTLRSSDKNRILSMLEALSLSQDGGSAESEKLSSELSRWKEQLRPSGGLTLKRAPEVREAELSPLGQFTQRMNSELAELAKEDQPSSHPLSVAESLIETASQTGNREKLTLAAALLYYLKLQGYLTGPYVVKLKDAEKGLAPDGKDAHGR